jgi:hypothetical protein
MIMSRRIFFGLLVVIVAVLSLSIPLDGVFAQGLSADAFERVRQVQEKHTRNFMAKHGVVGTAIGLGQGAQPVILILLEYGGVPGIPEHLDGIQLRPLVTGKIYALPKPDSPPGQDKRPPEDEIPVDPTARFDRPVPIGVSTGHPAITAGTIGCRVIDGQENVYALSNNHVYANSNKADMEDPAIQPGAYDGGVSPDDDIGTLSDFEPISFGGSANTIDAAIVLTSTDDLDNATPSDGYGIPKSTTVPSDYSLINKPVMKYGRTTGLTKGKVYAVSATVSVGYGESGTALFENQIIISPGTFSAGGDSGSLVVIQGKGKNKEDDRKPVGLLFAGSTLYTIANPIDAVLSRFGVTIDGDE